MLLLSIIIAFFSWICITTYEVNKFGVKTIETIPVNMCGLMFVLHFLAFFDKLNFIDVIGVIVIIAVALYYLICRKKLLLTDLKAVLLDDCNITLVLVGIIVLAGLFGRHIAAYDDFKFWAAEAKSMFFQKGYGPVYTNIASQYFGDYPLGTVLIQWYFEHFTTTFHENILYIAQALFSFSFLISITKRLRSAGTCAVAALFVVTFYSAFTKFGISLAPDRTMAVVFGAALVMVVDYQETKNVFYQIGFTLSLSALCLMKSIGFIWAFFAISFYIYYISKNPKKKVSEALMLLFIPLVSWSSWLIYCKVNNRVAYLTTNALGILKQGLPDQIGHFAEHIFIVKMYLKLLLIGNVNCMNNYTYSSGLNLSVMGFAVLLSVIFIWLIKRYKEESIKKKYVASLVIMLCFYLLLLAIFLFPFSNEFDGKNYVHMLGLISRYASPALMSGWILLVDELLTRQDISLKPLFSLEKSNYWLTAVILLLIINIPFAFVSLFGHYWKANIFEVSEDLRNERANYYAAVIKQIEDVEDPCNSRILYCDYRMSIYNYSYLHYFMSPISTINCIDMVDSDELINMAKDNRCTHIFISDTYNIDGCEWIKELTDDFEFNTLYKIHFTDNRIVLTKY